MWRLGVVTASVALVLACAGVARGEPDLVLQDDGCKRLIDLEPPKRGRGCLQDKQSEAF